MKTIKIKFKFTYYFIAKYLKNRLKSQIISNQILRDVNRKLDRICQSYIKLYNEEKEYNLNARMKRRNKYWRKKNNYSNNSNFKKL